MTLQELRFIIALAREKHFGNASKRMHVSQPTLSIAIKKLEKELGVTLFERNKNDVYITPIGKEVIERALRVVAEADAIKEAAKCEKDQLNAPLKLGAIYTVGPYLLPPMIVSLQKLAPQMSLEIQEDYTANLREKLNAGELDAIVISYPFSVPGIVTKTLYEEPFVVLMAENSELAKFPAIEDKMLLNQNILMLGEGHCFREQVKSSCPACFKSKSGASWHTVAGSSLETIRQMVAAKMGVTILPATAARPASHLDNLLAIRPLKGGGTTRTIALAWRQSFPRLKAIDLILKVVTECQTLNSAINSVK